MPLLTVKIIVVCTSLLAWFVLSFAWISLFTRRRRNKKLVILAISILTVLWGVTFFNTWYEGFYLFRRLALIPSLNSWALTLFTPLFYLYYRFRFTGQYPDKQQWAGYLSFPGILAVIYISMWLSSTPDKLIYSWDEFWQYYPVWWILFRIGCCLFWVIQLLVFLPGLFNMTEADDREGRQTFSTRREMRFALYLCFVFMVSMLIPSYIGNLLYNFSIIVLGGYILGESAFYRITKRKLGLYILPDFIFHGHVSEKTKKKNKSTLLTPSEIEQMNQLLNTTGLLHNPNLTLVMLARELSTNVTYLSRYFNHQLGVSFPEYITTCRLDKAEVLLKETDIKIVEISEQVGFQTLSTFYQAFNTRYKMPPSLWRKNQKIDSCDKMNS